MVALAASVQRLTTCSSEQWLAARLFSWRRPSSFAAKLGFIRPMNKRTLLLLGGWMVLTTIAAQEPESSPILTGDNVQAITPQIIETVQALTRKVTPPPASTRLWMLRRRSRSGGKPDTEFASIDALLWPRVFTARLIRGRLSSATTPRVPTENIPRRAENAGLSPSETK